MTNGKPTAQEHLSKAVADSTKAPEPSLWVRIVQMVFAGLTLGGAVAVALLLILHGPPAPKEPEGPEGDSGSKTAKTSTASGSVATYLVASSDEPAPAADGGGGAPASGDSGSEQPAGADQGSGEGDEGSEESESSTADSLANLNEQAPWAFAIVALLVGAFIATGKSLNFNGTQEKESSP